MEKFLICKVILFSYKDFQEMCDSIDKRVKKIALSTMHGKDVKKAFDEITRLIDIKRVYCNLKVIVDDVFETIGDHSFLVLRFVKGLKNNQVAKITGDEEEKVEAKVKTQIRRFCNSMLRKYSQFQLLNIISDSEFLFRRYKKELKKYKDRWC